MQQFQSLHTVLAHKFWHNGDRFFPSTFSNQYVKTDFCVCNVNINCCYLYLHTMVGTIFIFFYRLFNLKNKTKRNEVFFPAAQVVLTNNTKHYVTLLTQYLLHAKIIQGENCQKHVESSIHYEMVSLFHCRNFTKVFNRSKLPADGSSLHKIQRFNIEYCTTALKYISKM